MSPPSKRKTHRFGKMFTWSKQFIENVLTSSSTTFFCFEKMETMEKMETKMERKWKQKWKKMELMEREKK